VTLVFGNRAASSRDAHARLDDPQDHERAEVWVIARRTIKAPGPPTPASSATRMRAGRARPVGGPGTGAGRRDNHPH
jgi:hypothetical protein